MPTFLRQGRVGARGLGRDGGSLSRFNGGFDLGAIWGELEERSFARHHFPQNHSEGVTISLFIVLGEMFLSENLGCGIANRTHVGSDQRILRPRDEGGGAKPGETRETKVRHLDTELGIDQEVFSLEISVDERWGHAVEEQHAAGGVCRHFDPKLPCHLHCRILQHRVERPPRHKLGDDEHFGRVEPRPHVEKDVGVSNFTHEFRLSAEECDVLLCKVETETLHSDRGAMKCALVHHRKTTLSHHLHQTKIFEGRTDGGLE
mmetsp:Transcript_18135/g.43368  ORF Transcript_18135/g.43368 Transcript_18135/m.43368 type:complete len:261 (-) Transcript_18135:881-1663(-)